MMNKIVEFMKKHKGLLAILVFFCPFVLISISIAIIKLNFLVVSLIPVHWNTVWIETEGYSFKLNDYLVLFIYFLQTVVTALFSYFIWKTSIKSNEISEELRKKDENKEKSYLKENALIVYYDLLLGLKDLKNLYEGRIIGKKVTIPKRLYFSNEWIKNVSVMKDELENKDMSQIYQLYGDLLTLKELLEVKWDSELDEELKRIGSKVFDKNYLDYVYEGLNIEDIQSILNIEYQGIFEKIKRIVFINSSNYMKSSVDNIIKIYANRNIIWYNGKIKDDNLSGEGKIYNENGKIRYDGEFDNNNFVKGMRYEYYSNGEKYLEMMYEEGKRVKGIVFSQKQSEEPYSDGEYDNDIFIKGRRKEYDKNGLIEYCGSFENGKYNGEGVKCTKQKTQMIGFFQNGHFVKGIEKNVLLYQELNGDVYDRMAEQQRMEEYIEREDEYEDYIKYEEESSIGYRIYGDVKWDNGECRIIKKSKRTEYIQETEI
ncbi:hypothetical protein CLTEP_22710 [Clostridium tepidiprofundi DSM 19306]|uniref:MORN repeat variant n=1 Tax=Clostridium tepidiprofundi DSM 19306 TaxID=1121338 RepID=A0A151AXU8_9CLOT|nr:hypothetical protein [Clostridium tepidiprofundi]KYH32227.1 hypothetical protein CLTEP_22710 [Clostridium tepidiprofundi DSM 19306]